MELFRHRGIRLGLITIIAASLLVVVVNVVRNDGSSTEVSVDGVDLNFDEKPSSSQGGDNAVPPVEVDQASTAEPDKSIVVNEREETGEAVSLESSGVASTGSADETSDSDTTGQADAPEVSEPDESTTTTSTTEPESPKPEKPPTTPTTTTTTTEKPKPKKPATTPTTTTTTTEKPKPTEPPTTPTTTTTTTISFDGTIDFTNADPEGPYGYRLTKDFGTISDDNFNLRRSTLRIFEDGVELGPAHTIHVDIRAEGEGRFSHWKASLYFSASDNSDPRTNGRTYTYLRE